MNKNGWGLRVELAFLLLFLICLIMAVIGLHRMGVLGTDDGVYDDSNGYIYDNVNFDYDALERKVTNAASDYYKVVYNSKSDDTIVVNTDKLKNGGYLDSIKDGRGKDCKGYAMIFESGNIVSYIKCTFYTTVGYNRDYE